MQEAYKAIGRVADQTFPAPITGESGTGKELIARAISQEPVALQASGFHNLPAPVVDDNATNQHILAEWLHSACRRRVRNFPGSWRLPIGHPRRACVKQVDRLTVKEMHRQAEGMHERTGMAGL